MIKKIKRKVKGFTLVELVVAIAILTVIIALASVTYIGIHSKINEKQYNNLANTIKIAARNYAEETGINKIFVQTLIDEGLIEVDDESKILHDPRDNSSLNCQILTYDKGNITLSQEKNPTCDITVLNDIAIKIQYINEKGEKEDLPNNYWFNNNITLSVTSTGAVPLDLSKATYLWSSPLAPDRTYSDETYLVNGNYVDDTFQVIVTIDDKKYTAYASVKIDKVEPRVYNLIDTNPDEWSKNKTFQFEISDSESGLNAWQITFDNNNPPSSWHNISNAGSKREIIKTTKDLSILREGEYVYVWVKDNVGNINYSQLSQGGSSSLQINNIDEGFDTVTLTGNPNNNTYTKNVTLTGSIQDTKSGAVAYLCSTSSKPPEVNSSSWQTITKTNEVYNVTCSNNLVTDNKDYYLHAKDDIGNIKTAKYTVTNIDKNIDYVSVIDTGSGYRTTANLRGTANDYKSGIVAYAFTTSKNRPQDYEWKPGYNNLSIDFIADKNVTYYFHVKDNADNWAYSEVKLTNIVVERNATYHLESTRNSYISKSGILYNAVAIKSAEVITDGYTYNGYANAELYGSTIYIEARGGKENINTNKETKSSSADFEIATSTTNCESGYVCWEGGKPEKKGNKWMCVSDNPNGQIEYRSNPSKYHKYECKNGEWTCTNGCPPPSTPPPSGYHYLDFYDCNTPSGSCSDGDEWGGYAVCTGLGGWDGDYPAECRYDDYKTTYSCSSGTYLSGSRCYYCSNPQATLNKYSLKCEYETISQSSYWAYDVIVYYYVLK